MPESRQELVMVRPGQPLNSLQKYSDLYASLAKQKLRSLSCMMSGLILLFEWPLVFNVEALLSVCKDAKHAVFHFGENICIR